MKKISIFISIVLAVLMVVCMPINVFAATVKGKYVSELVVAYGDNGRADLIAKGYKVVEGNLNDGATKKDQKTKLERVWLGYKTTANKEEAICDIAVMNMNGNYSYVDYLAMLETQKQEINELLSGFTASIAELRENYNKGKETAKLAVELLDYYYEDDSESTLGQFFIDETKSTEENLKKLFLQGNAQYLLRVEQLIAIGLAESSDDNIVTRLEDAIYGSDEYTGDLKVTNANILEEIRNFQNNLSYYNDLKVEIANRKNVSIEDVSSEMINDYIYDDANDFSDGDVTLIQETEFLIKVANQIDYANTGWMLYDVITADPDDDIDDDVLYPLSASMTAGQRGALPVVGLSLILSLAFDFDSHLSDMRSTFEEIVGKDVEAVSIYLGVDRTLFTSPDNVALTTSAYRESFSDTENTFTDVGKKDGEFEHKYLTFGAKIGIGVTAVAGIALLIVSAKAVSYYRHVVEVLAASSTRIDVARYNKINKFVKVFSKLKYVGVALIVVACVIAIVLGVIDIIVNNNKKNKEEQDFNNKTYAHNSKPRVIVDNVEEKGRFTTTSYYANYYAVLDLNGNIADINGNDVGSDGQSFNYTWNVLYVSKNVGEPILSGSLKITSIEDTSGNYCPLHDFYKGSEEKIAADLNLGVANKGLDNYKSVYVYYKSGNVSGSNLAGTTMTTANIVLLSVVSLVVGAGITFTVVTIINNKKKKVA